LITDWSQQVYNSQVGATKRAELGADILPTGYLGRAMESINAPETGSQVVTPQGQLIPTTRVQQPIQPPVPTLAPTTSANDLKVPDNLPPPNIPDMIEGHPPDLPSLNDLKIPDTFPPLPQIPDRPPPPSPLTKPARTRPMRARRNTPRPLPPIPTIDDELEY
jgi:hypothetical protein